MIEKLPVESRAHPRVCGENQAAVPPEARQDGSSPRVRGKPALDADRVEVRGLIPACAGKTTPRRKTPRRLTAHPRVCGENSTVRCPAISSWGSSPRVRGKPVRVFYADRSRGLIPACAGKTGTGRSLGFRHGAHPRVCGENVREPFRKVSAMGSSPRVRGKRSCRDEKLQARRLIPACAGKTALYSRP